jgi:sigma-54 specific flagellar transcriptional regulator A
MAYDWPGNVREISNLMMRFSVLFSGEKIDIPSLPTYLLPDGMAEIMSELFADELIDAQTPQEQYIPEPLFETGAPGLSQQHADELDITANDIEHVLRISNSIGNFPANGIKAKEFIADIEIRLIKAALTQANGSVSLASQLLHMQRTTLIQKIARYKIATAFL